MPRSPRIRASRPRATRRRCARPAALGAAIVAVSVLGLGVHPGGAADAKARYRLEPVATVADATAMAIRPGDRTRYVATQPGEVVAIRPDGTTDTVLDLDALVQSGGERGLLGLAFAPDGKRLYIHYSGDAAGETVLEEYRMDGSRPDPTSRRVVLTVPQPQPNHNGGQVAFGPDGLLYLGLGDGGGRDDRGAGHAPGGNGQSLDTLLGKVLRIDPTPTGAAAYTVPSDNPFARGGGRPEIYVSGLRNPWRFSFDPATGDLWIADVGQDRWEEVTRLPAGSIAGANLGWNVFEATHRFRDGSAEGLVMPQIETSHADGNCSITGGYVYRGKALRALRGWYVYSDYCNGELVAAKVGRSGALRERWLGVDLPRVSSFGVDADGELYVLSQSEGVFRLAAR